MTTLNSIVYVSTAIKPMTPRKLEALLTTAREFNLRNGITGVLLYEGGHFLQCFEGPEAAVQITYERIKRSRQHSDIKELMNRTVQQRGFEGWEMGLALPTRSELLTLSTARWRQQAHQADNGFELLKLFWRNSQR